MRHLLTIYGAADLLRISPRKLGELIRDNRVPYIELPTGDVRFDARDLMDWADGFKRPTTEAQPALPRT